jgi:hypothetical protein
MQHECAFREHPADVTGIPTEKYGVGAYWFQCKECPASYTVSEDLLDLYAKRWKQDASGATLSRLARRLSAQGERLELITETQLKQALAEQGSFEQEQSGGLTWKA